MTQNKAAVEAYREIRRLVSYLMETR